MAEVFARAFARQLYQAEAGEAVEGNAGAVEAEGFGQFLQYGFAVHVGRHVDKVDDDDAAQIAQAKFARDGVAGFEVGFENGFVEIARADEAAGVHVYRRHGFGGFDNQVAAEIEIDARLEGAVDFGFDVVGFKQRPLAGEELDFFRRALNVLGGEMLHFGEVFF